MRDARLLKRKMTDGRETASAAVPGTEKAAGAAVKGPARRRLVAAARAAAVTGGLLAFASVPVAAASAAGAADGAAKGGVPAVQGQTMVYEVYAGGVNAVTATFDVGYGVERRYNMSLHAKTRGFLEKLVPWSGTFETAGWRMPQGGGRPETHKSTAVWRGENDSKEYNYGKDGSFRSLKAFEAGKDVTPKTIDDALTQGTTDALTAALHAMEGVAEKGSCNSSAEIFDGSRRYRLVFRQEAEDEMERNRYNIYRGKAMRCSAEVSPVAGKWRDKPRGWMSIQEQGRDKGSLPTVWLAQIDEDTPAVPVKIRVKTDYGTLFMHLVSYEKTVPGLGQ